MKKPLWVPDSSLIETASITTFAKTFARTSVKALPKTLTEPLAEPSVKEPSAEPSIVQLPSYEALHQWSVEAPETFWSAVWDFCDVIGDKGERVLLPSNDIRSVRFFPDSQVSLAENMLRNPNQSTAIIALNETGAKRTITRAALYALSSRIWQALKAAGVKQGDRVVGFVPNMIETVAAMLATNALGAIWSSCSPDFGVEGVTDRFGQITPKILFAANQYHYNGQAISCIETLQQISDAIPSIEKIVIWPYHTKPVHDSLNEQEAHLPEMNGLPKHFEKAISLATWLVPFQPCPIQFQRMAPSEPGFILFSSGTTGKPKCIIHSATGILLQHLKEHQLHVNLKPNDRLFYFTTCGWMMWNWLVTALASNAALVLYEGNPFYPQPNRLVALIEDERITHFGTSAKAIDHYAKMHVVPCSTHDLTSLCTVLSTGSPLSAASFDYIYQHWKPNVHLASICGGTDICACFIGGNPLQPVYSGEIQGAMLGMDVQVFDHHAQSTVGMPGELVCANAHPSMPLGFWGDKEGEAYRHAYFASYDNVWRQGDWLTETEQGGYVVAGRSDATLNPGGVRIGTAEIYRQAERVPEVLESLAIGQEWQDDQRIILFVRLLDNQPLTQPLTDSIRSIIRTHASPRHVPAKVIAVTDIPRTKSGKVVELAVREVVHRRPVKNLSALANPEALSLYKNLPELESS